jgi:hypothetical protein
MVAIAKHADGIGSVVDDRLTESGRPAAKVITSKTSSMKKVSCFGCGI